MSGIRSAVPIPPESIRTESVIVRARTTLDDWHRRDAQRNLTKEARLENALRSHERNALAFVRETARQEVPRKGSVLGGQPDPLLEKPESLESHERIGIFHRTRLFYRPA